MMDHREMALSGCEMRPHHRELILNNHGYLLHNLHPTEDFWAALIDKNIFSQSMIDEIKQHGNTTSCTEYMLSLLPKRGPDAFDCFCDVLLECDHKHVAECLMMQEGTDKFRDDVNRYCATNGNCDIKLQVDKLVDIFQKIIPRIKHFLERKFDLDIREQDFVFNEKEMELAEMEEEKKRTNSRFKALDEFMQQMSERGQALAREVRRDYISRATLREERKLLDEILDSAYEKDYADYANSLHTSLMTLIDYLETTTALKLSERRPPTSHEDSVDAQMSREPNTPATVRVQNIMECIQDFVEQISPCAIVDRDTVRNHLDLVLRRLKDVSEDMYYVREVFIGTLQKKEEMTDETVSLVKNYKELQRLEREMAEKRKHILELRQQGKLIQKKGGRKPNTRQLEQCKKNIEEQKAQLAQIETKMRRQVQSADQRVRFILQLIPDREGNSDELLLRSGASTAWDLYPEDSFLDIDTPDLDIKRDPNATRSAPVKQDRKQRVVVAQEEGSSAEKKPASKAVVVQESNPERARRESSVDTKPATAGGVREAKKRQEKPVIVMEETPRSSRSRQKIKLKDGAAEPPCTKDNSPSRSSSVKVRQVYGADSSSIQRMREANKPSAIKPELKETGAGAKRSASSDKRTVLREHVKPSPSEQHTLLNMAHGSFKSAPQSMPPLADRISALAMPRRHDNSPRRASNLPSSMATCREIEGVSRRPSLTVTDMCDFRVLTPENATRRDHNLNRLTPDKDKPGTLSKKIPNRSDLTAQAITTKTDEVIRKDKNIELNNLSRPSSSVHKGQASISDVSGKSRSSTPTLPYISIDNNSAYSSRALDTSRREDATHRTASPTVRALGSARRSPSHDVRGDWRSIGIDVTANVTAAESVATATATTTAGASIRGGQAAEAVHPGRNELEESLYIPDSNSVSSISARSEEVRSSIVLRKSRDVKSSPRRNALDRRKAPNNVVHGSLEGQVITEDVRGILNGMLSNRKRSDVRAPMELGGLEGQPALVSYTNPALGGSLGMNQATPRAPQRSSSIDERAQPPREILTTKKVKLG